jgi:septum formation protein
LRLPFDVVAPEVDESPLPGEPAMQTALRLAKLKALAVSDAVQDALIIGSDQVASLEGEHIGKPGNHRAAVEQLRAMRGKAVVFYTAVCLYNSSSGRTQCACVPTEVVFRDLGDTQIERYLRLETPYDCAGSARIEGLGIALVEKVHSDDPTALLGLPLIRLISMLRNEGVETI